ncbi:MAG: AlkZ family DNA glycosylase, partial [Oscillospiraceae bacterium]|nr:AlkZ family DNA glycosylase [Oscillospiraceae bacterium]
MTISKETARDFLVNYQDLNDMRGLEGYEGALAYMQRVRCIQYDPLDVVGRNADLVLQSRIKNYAPKMLEDLLYKDRALIDAVDKVLSIIPVDDYLPMTRMRKTASDDLVRILGYRGSLDALDVADSVVEHIRINGPQTASKIDIGGRAKDGSWGHRKISSAALDYLYHSGRLGIRTKINTQKVYDLMERLFPEDITHGEDPFPDEHEFLKWYVLRRIGSIGMVWDRNTGAWIGYHIQNAHPRTEIIHELVDDGRLAEVRIEGSEDTYYIRSEDEGLLGVPADRNKVSFIAPLDNFIWDREMTEEIFGFRYRWE